MVLPILSDVAQWLDTFTIFLNSEHCPPRNYPVVYGQYHDLSSPFIFYNTEQLSRSNKLEDVITISRNSNCVEIWDYSKANVDICNSVGIKVVHVPLVIPDSFISTIKEYRKAEHIYDVGFAGYLSERRVHIKNRLEALGYKTHFIGATWGEERDIQLAKCKIHINIHAFDDYKIFESNRCEPWLAIGVPVISEHSVDNDQRCINVSYDELVDAVVKCLPRD